MFSRESIEKLWYSANPLSYLLLPLSWLYLLLIILRRLCYQSGILAVDQVDATVIIVGNISVGGTGKTPLVIWLAEYFKNKGFNPGIVSRGFGGKPAKEPQQVRNDSNPAIVGDEPVLIARNVSCPVAVAIQRRKAAEELIQHCGCDLILCDDGLQHYSLERDIEIAVVDGQRRFGNGRCLPAGPLREPVSRLDSVDLVVSKNTALRHQYRMEYVYDDLVSIKDADKTLSIDLLQGQCVHAVAGIGNPDSYFAYLRKRELDIIKHEFCDHHAFIANDLNFNDGLPVIMTEKDAVKCSKFPNENYWYLPVKAKLPESFNYRLDTLFKEILNE